MFRTEPALQRNWRAPHSKILSGEKFSVFAAQVSEKANPKPSTGFCEFVEVCVRPLVEPICSSKKIKPADLWMLVRHHIHSSLADADVRIERLGKLQSLVGSDECEEEASQYLAEFCRRLTTSIVTFVLNLMRNVPTDPHVVSASKFSQDDFDSFSKQTLHNILGSIVKSVLRRSRQYKGNPKWDDIQKVILSRFAHVGVMEARPHETTFWTALLGRNSYTFVSESVLDFFVEVAKILCYVETTTGSIPIEEVLISCVKSCADFSVVRCCWKFIK